MSVCVCVFAFSCLNRVEWNVHPCYAGVRISATSGHIHCFFLMNLFKDTPLKYECFFLHSVSFHSSLISSQLSKVSAGFNC